VVVSLYPTLKWLGHRLDQNETTLSHCAGRERKWQPSALGMIRQRDDGTDLATE
jgi:hypothetical protein